MLIRIGLWSLYRLIGRPALGPAAHSHGRAALALGTLRRRLSGAVSAATIAAGAWWLAA